MRVGIGYDIHRLVPAPTASCIPLGGVPIPCSFRVEAHSDGDVLLHALVDACLGALALGDIGQWFPDDAPENKNRSSADFVARVMATVREKGWDVANLDSVVFAESPKIGPYADAIRRSISTILGIELASVSLKAKTMEGLGPIGERRAIAAQAIVALKEKKGFDASASNQQPLRKT